MKTYKLLSSTDDDLLEKMVNRHLKEGSELVGGPTMNGKYIVQAVLMEETER